MMKRLMITMLLSIGAALPSAAVAAELKIGFVDVKSAVENTERYQRGLKELSALKKRKEKALDELRSRIEQAQKELLSQSMAMSQERLAEKEHDIKEMRKKFSRRQQDAQEELISRKNRLDQKILKRFYAVVRAFGKEHHYDMVLPKSSAIYFDPAHDVTARITKLLDADAAKEEK
ncbi:MAG: OmpH family outer membrane protein [Zetaproteobacteria bacterium]|nr:MAG: OmpH family outer membrane protein [Zetaproteobacteria bacterium]